MGGGARLGLVGVALALALATTWCRRGKQLAGAGDVLGADAAGEQAVVANAMKAGWQDMHEEAADELVGREPHDLLPGAAFGLQEIQVWPPRERGPPPGTIMWTWGWWVSADPHVCSTEVTPIRAPRCLGSAAMVSKV